MTWHLDGVVRERTPYGSDWFGTQTGHCVSVECRAGSVTCGPPFGAERAVSDG